MRIAEVNSLDLKGSLGKNLTANKFWAFTELSKFKTDFSTVYILGSWYGNAALLMSMDNRFTFDKIINVDVNKTMLSVSDQLANKLGDDRIESMRKDVNQLDYRQADSDSLIVNFSTTNIGGDNWFVNIPDGTTVLMAGRDNDPGAVNQFDNLKEFVDMYPLSNVLLAKRKQFQDPETDYNSFLVIGSK